MKNPNRGRNTRKLTAHGCCEGAAAPNAGMGCPKRQGITAGSPEGGQCVAMRRVLWQDKPCKGGRSPRRDCYILYGDSDNSA